MSNVVNLRQARKAARRAAQKAEADENAARCGLSKAEKELQRARLNKANRDLDGHKADE